MRTLARDPFQAADVAGMLAEALAGVHPHSREVDSGAGAIVQFRAIPLHPRAESLGALVLLQDVTELRRRDRQIMSKDATIREIHHRVKNNLQTVAALLRLQSRRVANAEARTALEESMRRVSSIALVHETLSSAIDEEVAFDEVVDRLLAMLGEVTGAAGRVRVGRAGSFGELPAELATPLVMVLTELVGNAVEHGFPDGRSGTVQVSGRRSEHSLTVAITDDGVGLPEKFSLDASDRLGLQIVQTLVGAELDASLELPPRAGSSRHRGDGGPPTVGSRLATGNAAAIPAGQSWHRVYPGRNRLARSAQDIRARARALRRFNARLSSSLRPPQTPASWPLSSAQARHSDMTGQRRQTAFASSICINAGPVLPIGKNSSGSSSRQTAR